MTGFSYRRERWQTPDGDFIDLDWCDGVTDDSNLLVLFHGLEGSSRSQYATNLMKALQAIGWAGVACNFRSCSGEINCLARSYHSGDSAEVDWILRRLKSADPGRRIYAAGVSLGANVLLKWLGEQGDTAAEIIERAVAVSAPLDLGAAVDALDHGFSKWVYTANFLPR
jgi:predicted alpha/beta-fold hydrolase